MIVTAILCVLLETTLSVRVNIGEPNNGESLSQPVCAKPKRHNAKLCPLVSRERIVNALASGDSQAAIARTLQVSRNTVSAVAEQEWSKVEQRKARIAAQCERNATLAASRINAKLESKDDIPLNVLVPVFGVSVDKLALLRGDASLAIRHEHLHRVSCDDLIAFAAQRALNARSVPGQVIDSQPALTDSIAPGTHQLQEKRETRLQAKTRRRKRQLTNS